MTKHASLSRDKRSHSRFNSSVGFSSQIGLMMRVFHRRLYGETSVECALCLVAEEDCAHFFWMPLCLDNMEPKNHFKG